MRDYKTKDSRLSLSLLVASRSLTLRKDYAGPSLNFELDSTCAARRESQERPFCVWGES